MESSSASTFPNRKAIYDLVAKLAIDPASVAVKDTWDLDKVSAQKSGGFKTLIPTNIDPHGEHTVQTESRPKLAAAPTAPVDIPEPVALLIVQGDMKIHHKRSPEEPPAHFLEGEDDDEAESDEDQAGGSAPVLLRKLARVVSAGNLATHGLVGKGFKFGPVLESHVPSRPGKKAL